MRDDRNYWNKLEVLINVIKVENGHLFILLFKKRTEPYKGYWMLPSSLLFTDETIEHCTLDTMINMVGYDHKEFYHVNVYSDKIKSPVERVIGCSSIALLDENKAKKERKKIAGFESEWFPISDLPKMVGNQKEMVVDAINYLRNCLNINKVLKILYPQYVTLKELQTLYEELYEQKLDRRNFRKKMLGSKIIEKTEQKRVKSNGRPASYYKIIVE